MLASPVLAERGRSRSREPRPLTERSGSRGRSLSTERRGSRPSSAGSMVDEDHMTSVLLRSGSSTSTLVYRACLWHNATQRALPWKRVERRKDGGGER